MGCNKYTQDIKDGRLISRILYLDDSSVTQFLIVDILEELNLDVDLIEGEVQVKSALADFKYDALLVNVDVVGLNIARLVDLCRNGDTAVEPIPVIALVDGNAPLAGQSGPDLGVDAYFYQPFDGNAFKDLLNRLLTASAVSENTQPKEAFISSPLDPTVQHELEERYQGERRHSLDKLVNTYRTLSIQLIDELTVAVSEEELDTGYQVAHSLKSCSANLAALPLSRLCNSLEQSFSSGSMEQAPLLLSSIQQEHGRVLEALGLLINKPSLEKGSLEQKVYPPATTHDSVEILVVDDDPTARMLASDALTNNGFNVMLAEDGLKALAAASERTPDLILLDVEMPLLDGFLTCEKLREQASTADTPIIMLTGRNDVNAVERSFEVKATDFFSKPVNWQVLVQRIRYVLRSAEILHQLKESERRLESTQRVAQVGYWDIDFKKECLYVSESLCQITGYTAEQLSTVDKFFKIIIPEDRARTRQELDLKILAGDDYQIEYRIKTSQGVIRRVEGMGSSTLSSDGALVWAMGTLHDVTEQREREELIYYQAHHDSLTGLHNRQSFDEQLQQAIKLHKRLAANLAVVYLDLDNFKHVNDSLGHHMGDQLLKIFGERLKAEIRDSDVLAHDTVSSIARLGGDEYTLLFSVLDKEIDAGSIAQRILAELEKPFKLITNKDKADWYDAFVTASIGIAIYPQDGENADELMKNADTAMYAAKNKGKNSYCFYDKSMNDLALQQLTMEGELRKAAERGEFSLHYQPRIDLQTGQMVSVEAVLRWESEKFGAVEPAEFIPLAEKASLILPISEWALEEACKQLKIWQGTEMSALSIAVSVSDVQFRQGTLRKSVSTLLDRYELDGGLLELELTEGIIMGDVLKTTETLRGLKELGLTISVDNFGTGYSSLGYLKRFAIDNIKVDQSFIRELKNEEDAAEIVDAIITLGHNLGIKLIADGVETREGLKYLTAKACDMGQGIYFSQPVCAADVDRFYKQHNSSY